MDRDCLQCGETAMSMNANNFFACPSCGFIWINAESRISFEDAVFCRVTFYRRNLKGSIVKVPEGLLLVASDMEL